MRLGQVPQTQPDSLPLWPPLLATRGVGGTSARHAHHAMHIVLAVDVDLVVAQFDVLDSGTHRKVLLEAVRARDT